MEAMKRHRVAFLLAGFLAGVPPVAAQEGAASPAEDEGAAVRAVVEALATDMREGNWAALDSLFSDGPGLHIIEGAGVNHGWAEYRDHHLKPELEEFENFNYRYYGVEPVVRGSVAWASFRYDLAADTPNGHVEVEGRGTAILEKSDRRWVVVHLHTSGRRKP